MIVVILNATELAQPGLTQLGMHSLLGAVNHYNQALESFETILPPNAKPRQCNASRG
jgi:hypothetical protein